MKPFIVLLISFCLSMTGIRLLTGCFDIALAMRIAMFVMLLFTSIAHFIFTKGMAEMLPAFVPFRKATVFLTGLVEIAGGIGLLIPSLQAITGWLLVIFFILILPANIHAAVKEVDYQHPGRKGKGLSYLWFRAPLQLLFILWVYFSAIAPHLIPG